MRTRINQKLNRCAADIEDKITCKLLMSSIRIYFKKWRYQWFILLSFSFSLYDKQQKAVTDEFSGFFSCTYNKCSYHQLMHTTTLHNH